MANGTTVDNFLTLKDIVTITIPAVITIIGFIIAYLKTTKAIASEINKQKTAIYLEKMTEVPYKLVELMNDAESSTEEELLNKVKFITLTTFVYGSPNAIKIAAKLQEENYQNATNGTKVLLYYTLLTCQIKYDLTEIETTPDSYYRIKINDYEDHKNNFKRLNNQIVNELNLESFLKIK